MKRNMLISVAGLALATALLVSASVWVSADRQVVWGHTEGITQDEIMEKLHQLTTADFLKDFDQAMEDIQNGKGDPELGFASNGHLSFQMTKSSTGLKRRWMMPTCGNGGLRCFIRNIPKRIITIPDF